MSTRTSGRPRARPCAHQGGTGSEETSRGEGTGRRGAFVHDQCDQEVPRHYPGDPQSKTGRRKSGETRKEKYIGKSTTNNSLMSTVVTQSTTPGTHPSISRREFLRGRSTLCLLIDVTWDAKRPPRTDRGTRCGGDTEFRRTYGVGVGWVLRMGLVPQPRLWTSLPVSGSGADLLDHHRFYRQVHTRPPVRGSGRPGKYRRLFRLGPRPVPVLTKPLWLP